MEKVLRIDKNVDKSVKNHSTYSEAYAWFIWSFAGLFYCYQFVLRVSPSVMTDFLMRDFAIEACSLGILSAFYYNSYTTLQVPIGLAMDKFGPTRLMRAAVLLCVAGTVIFSISDSLYFAAFGRLIIGMGSTCAFLGSVKLATIWFKPERLALVVGFTLLAGKIGATLGQAPMAYLTTMMGWRGALYIISGIGVLIAIGIWIFIKDEPPYGVQGLDKDHDTSYRKLFSRLKDIAINYRIWALGIYGSMMYVPLSAFADLWGTPYLMKLYDISREQAGFATSMIFIGAGIGSPLVAIISDYFEDRKWTMIWGAVLSLVVNAIIIMVANIPYAAMLGLLLLVGIFFSSQPLIFSSVCQITPHASNGTVVSFANMIVMISGVVMQPLLGYLLDWIWTGTKDNGVPLYSISDYRFALTSILICLLIGLVMMIFVPETFPKGQNKA
ncbi:MFS transporter [Candidatus Bealeia paramacronuclearis]|uniref:Lysosomal dipeptide transporter MFSD1 n=1 Tax=Candidatus Bealeia paramacronuclearis TaxID=1921001 RepID=A0ABZ2C1Q7_9PROT|nr:MFS transporter [Candidatus Bealeia paramacronuclearis]